MSSLLDDPGQLTGRATMGIESDPDGPATEIDPDLKVMFITGFAAVALNPDSNAPKDAKILSKPFHLRDLVNEVEKMLKAA